MPRRKTHEDFLKDVKRVHGDDYTILEEYKNNRTKIKIRHNECGRVYKTTPKIIIGGSECPYCTGRRTLTHDEFCEKVTKQKTSDYKVLSQYKDTNTKIKVFHRKCGYSWKVNPRDFMNKSNCPYCNRHLGGSGYYTDLFKHDLFLRYRGRYELLEEYKGAHIKTNFKHSCGNNFKAYPTQLLAGKTSCPKCFGSGGQNQKYHIEFVSDIIKEYGDEYKVVTKYKDSKNKILFRHNKCGYEWKVNPSNILAGKSHCPNCSQKISKQEEKISEYLKYYNIDYKREYSFKDLRDKSPLRFDFVIFNSSKDIDLLIEYDGEYHYIDFDHISSDDFKNQQKRDKLKNIYCKKNDIDLLRIPYWDKDNIEDILIQEVIERNQGN